MRTRGISRKFIGGPEPGIASGGREWSGGVVIEVDHSEPCPRLSIPYYWKRAGIRPVRVEQTVDQPASPCVPTARAGTLDTRKWILAGRKRCITNARTLRRNCRPPTCMRLHTPGSPPKKRAGGVSG